MRKKKTRAKIYTNQILIHFNIPLRTYNIIPYSYNWKDSLIIKNHCPPIKNIKIKTLTNYLNIVKCYLE